jgi:hypothetical protein
MFVKINFCLSLLENISDTINFFRGMGNQKGITGLHTTVIITGWTILCLYKIIGAIKLAKQVIVLRCATVDNILLLTPFRIAVPIRRHILLPRGKTIN